MGRDDAQMLAGMPEIDRVVVGLQAKEAEFMLAFEIVGSRQLDLQELEDRAAAYPFYPNDILAAIIRDAGDRLKVLGPNE